MLINLGSFVFSGNIQDNCSLDNLHRFEPQIDVFAKYFLSGASFTYGFSLKNARKQLVISSKKLELNMSKLREIIHNLMVLNVRTT